VISPHQAAYDDFIHYLGSNDALFGDLAQREHVVDLASRRFSQIREEIRRRVDAMTKAGEGLDEARIQSLQTQIINDHALRISSSGFARNMDEAHEEAIRTLYTALINEGISAVFEKLPLTEEDRASLRRIIVLLLTRDEFAAGSSGVVVAGF